MSNDEESILYKIQQDLVPVTKNAQGYGYKYADLGAVWETVQPILEKYKVMVSNYADGNNIVTVLTTSNGETIGESSIPLEYAKAPNPQDVGAAITYFRRYNLLLLLNIIVEDDDAAKAQKNMTKNKPTF